MRKMFLIVSFALLVSVSWSVFATAQTSNQATISSVATINAPHAPPGVVAPSPVYLIGSVQQDVTAIQHYQMDVGDHPVAILTRRYTLGQLARARWQPTARYS